MTIVLEIQLHGSIPDFAIEYMEEVFPKIWRIEIENYYEYIYSKRK